MSPFCSNSTIAPHFTQIKSKILISNGEAKTWSHSLLFSSLFTWLQPHWVPSYLLKTPGIYLLWDTWIINPSCSEFSLPRFQVVDDLTSIESLLKYTLSLRPTLTSPCTTVTSLPLQILYPLSFFPITLNHLQVQHINYLLCFYFFTSCLLR